VNERSFDYVIVGAGSAGCVLANRLSEEANVSVCLIEAGPRNRHPYIHIPLLMIGLLYHPTLNWNFRSTNQKHAGNRPIIIPRGKTLGGSSSINGMVYVRGHPFDYDDWAKEGNAGWGYADVLPYFRRSEHNEGLGGSPYHARGGLMSVVDPTRANPMNEVFLEAAEQLQYRRRRDFNDDDQEGFGYHQLTQRNGIRESTATAFLEPARGCKNLTILTEGQVTRIVIENNRALGVEMQSGERIAARREVILSAGAINSPALLMRSGIGDGAMLTGLGIPVVHHLPGVGRNLQDHMGLGVQVESNDTRFYGISFKGAHRLLWAGIEYALFRRGMLASNVVEACGFLRTAPGLDRPDIQYGFMPARRGVGARLVGRGHGYGLVTILLKPKSRGTVRLSEARAPVIDLNAFGDGDDLETFLKGYKISRRILRAPAFAQYHLREARPGDEVQSDQQLADYIRDNAGTIYHPVGTCRMGQGDEAVVDAELRVHGFDGLRVVDASIMPTIVGGNTNAPTIMIAEKASDMIRGRAPLAADSI
jgi:choline dehydrogenase